MGYRTDSIAISRYMGPLRIYPSKGGVHKMGGLRIKFLPRGSSKRTPHHPSLKNRTLWPDLSDLPPPNLSQNSRSREVSDLSGSLSSRCDEGTNHDIQDAKEHEEDVGEEHNFIHLRCVWGNGIIGSVPTTPDPNTSAKVSRYKWETYRDTNWCIYYFLPQGGHTFTKVCHRNGRCIAILFRMYWGQGSIWLSWNKVL